MDPEIDLVFKIVLIGDSEVGKSTLILRSSSDSFNETYMPTIGVDFRIQNMAVEGKNIKLQLWDTAGQERYKTTPQLYYNGKNCIILTYSTINRESFLGLDKWIKEAETYAAANVLRILVGTKTDLEKNRQVQFQEGQTLAQKLGIEYIEVSAKENNNVQELFQIIVKKILQKQKANA